MSQADASLSTPARASHRPDLAVLCVPANDRRRTPSAFATMIDGLAGAPALASWACRQWVAGRDPEECRLEMLAALEGSAS